MDFNVDGTTDLPFIRMIEGKKDFWFTQPTGDWGKDCATGNEFGDLLHRYVFFGNMPILLSTVARAITAKGHFGGIETGFFHTIGAGMCTSGMGSGLALPTDSANLIE